MENQTIFITRHNLSTLFEKTLKLLKPTWKASLIDCAILYVPVAVASAFFIQSYIGFCLKLVQTAESLSSDPMAIFGQLLPFLGFTLLYGVIVGVISSFATAVVSRNAFRAASGETPGWKELMLGVLRDNLGSLVVFYILESLITFGSVLVFTVLITLLVVLASVAKAVVLAVVAGVLLYLSLILLLMALQYVFQFGPTAIANEGISGGAAIARCFSLAKGQFWRVVGLSILFTMALSLALSMATMPLQFASLAPFYTKLLESAMSGADSNPAEILIEMSEAFKGFGLLYGLLVAVQSVLTGMVQPLFTTLLYADLRVRKGELADAAESPAPSDQGQA